MWFTDVLHWSKGERVVDDSWVRVIDLATDLLRFFRHAVDMPTQYGRDGWDVERSHQYAVQEMEQRETARRWEASNTGRHLFHFLPHHILQHSILPFLDVRTLLQLRSVSRTVQSLAEQAACVWMNRRFPAGLRTIARQQVMETWVQPKSRKRKLVSDELGSAVMTSSSVRKDSSFPSSSPSLPSHFASAPLLWCPTSLPMLCGICGRGYGPVLSTPLPSSSGPRSTTTSLSSARRLPSKDLLSALLDGRSTSMQALRD